MNRKAAFQEKGYHIEENVYQEKDMSEMFFLFYDVFSSIITKNAVPLTNTYPSISEVSYAENMKTLDHMMLDIFNFNKDLLGEGYDIISYSSAFFRFLSKPTVESIAKELLGLSEHNTLYGWTNRIRIDPPRDERRTYGWHQEVFYCIPKSRYLQTWCPVLRDTTIQNGTIEICPGSHAEKIAKQSWNEIPGRATQVIVDQAIVDKYEQVQLEMKVGDLLFFDGYLFHQSGSNSTKDEIRFSLVGMWNDINESTFKGPKPSFVQRTTLTAKQYWEQENKNGKWGY